MSDLGPKLTQFAENMLDDLLADGNEDVSFSQKIDALKALSALHLGIAKINGRLPDDDVPAGGGVSMSMWKARAASAGDGHA